MIVSWIKGKSLALLGSVALCAIVWGGLASNLYVGSQKELASLQEQYRQVETKLNESIESKKTLENSCKVDKQALLNLQTSLAQNKKEEDIAVVDITSYQPKCKAVLKQGEVTDEKEYVTIDDPFDPEFIRLSESGISN